MSGRWIRRTRCGAAAAVIALLSGCALTPETIELSPAPLAAAAPVPAARGVEIAVAVADRRGRRDRVSTKKNSHGTELAPIRASQDVALTLQQAIGRELQARGFGLRPSGAPLAVEVELAHLNNEFTVMFTSVEALAQVQMTVTVRAADGTPRYRRSVDAEARVTKLPIVTGAYAQRALNQALESALATLFGDADFTAALLGRPMPGAAPS